jgi:hypothetical protein
VEESCWAADFAQSSCCRNNRTLFSTAFVTKLSMGKLGHCCRQIHPSRIVHLLVAAPLCFVGKIAPSPWALLLLLVLLVRLGH